MTLERKLWNALRNHESGVWFEGVEFETLRRKLGDQLTVAHLDRLSTRTLKAALRKAGLELVEIQPVSEYDYLINHRKPKESQWQ